MGRFYILLALAILSFASVHAGDPCEICPSRGDNSWVTARFVSMQVIEPGIGEIVVNIQMYTFGGDDECPSFDMWVDRDCVDHYVVQAWFDLAACGVWCSSQRDTSKCMGGGYCEECGYSTHSFDDWNFHFITWGKGTLKFEYQGNLILQVPFDFGIYGEYGEPVFDYVEFLNRDLSPITDGDKFDALESVAIEVSATWPEEPAPAILVEFKSDMISEPLRYEAMLEESSQHVGIYRILFPEGHLSPLVGDPESLPFLGEEITAVPVPNSCDAEPGQVHDELTVVNYRLTVEEVSFVGDHPLFKDTAITNPPIVVPISDPVWLRTPAKNEPAAYTKNSPYQMNVLVKSSHVPFHDFRYKIKAVTEGNSYNTREYTRHMMFTDLDTVEAITPVIWGHFPDHVGIIDSLRFHWLANKLVTMGENGYRWINPSGPHKIYLTYDKPKLDTVNTLALEKICRYAENQNVDTVIAERGVMGVYNEGWRYDPDHPIFRDPLNVVRDTIGQCGDYANLMTTLFKSVGLVTNPTVIYNGFDTLGMIFLPIWKYSERVDSTGDTAWVSMLTDNLRSCDGNTAYWEFVYHAVCRYGNYYCDGALGLFEPLTNYNAWWRFYLFPPSDSSQWTHDEPPVGPPVYYQWPNLVPAPPNSVLPTPIHFEPTDFVHP